MQKMRRTGNRRASCAMATLGQGGGGKMNSADILLASRLAADQSKSAGSKLRSVPQNSQVTPMRPSSPIISLRSCGEKLLKQLVDALVRTAAEFLKRAFGENLDAALVEKAIEQSLARKRRIDKFVVFKSGGERLAFGPMIAVVLGRLLRARPARRRAEDRGRARRPGGKYCSSSPPARQLAPCGVTLSATASLTKDGICSDCRK